MSVKEILTCVVKELHQASNSFNAFNSPHEGYAVIKEEVDELWGDIMNNESCDKMKHEAIQIAAMAVRFVYDLC